MGHPDKKGILRTRDDDILLAYAHAYYAANGFPAHLRLLKSGRYAIDGTEIHKGKPIIVSAVGYNIFELPGMTKSLLGNAIAQRQIKLIRNQLNLYVIVFVSIDIYNFNCCL